MELLHRRLSTCPEWLKDRKGLPPALDDVKHYQRIPKTLFETDRIMSTVTMTLEAAEPATP